MRRLILFLSSLVFAFSPALAGQFHVVRAGDTLSAIALRYLGGPVYRHRVGSLHRLMVLNPEIIRRDEILPGQRIRVSAEEDRAVATVEPPIAESAAAAVAEPAAFIPASRLGVAAGFEYFRIDSEDRATGGQAVLLSAMNPTLRLHWDLDWTETWSSAVRLQFSNEKMRDGTASGNTLVDGDGTRTGFEFGALRRWSADQRTGFLLGSGERIFGRAVSATAVALERVPFAFLKAEHETTLFRRGGARAGVGASLQLDQAARAAGAAVQNGWTGDLSASIHHEFARRGFEINARVNYGAWSQTSDFVRQRERHVGLMLGLTGKLDD